MASTIGLVLILLGGFVVAVSYQMVSDCQRKFSNSNCWDPFLYRAGSGAFGLYIGLIITIAGTVILVGPNVTRRLRK